MASEDSSTMALLLFLNLILFPLVSSNKIPCTPPAPKSPKPYPKSPPPAKASCPTDTLKLGVCADVLGLVNVVAGKPASTACCTVLQGLADLEAAVCLCTAIKANILGNNLNVPVSLSLLLNYCGKSVPSGFQCG